MRVGLLRRRALFAPPRRAALSCGRRADAGAGARPTDRSPRRWHGAARWCSIRPWGIDPGPSLERRLREGPRARRVAAASPSYSRRPERRVVLTRTSDEFGTAAGPRRACPRRRWRSLPVDPCRRAARPRMRGASVFTLSEKASDRRRGLARAEQRSSDRRYRSVGHAPEVSSDPHRSGAASDQQPVDPACRRLGSDLGHDVGCSTTAPLRGLRLSRRPTSRRRSSNGCLSNPRGACFGCRPTAGRWPLASPLDQRLFRLVDECVTGSGGVAAGASSPRERASCSSLSRA